MLDEVGLELRSASPPPPPLPPLPRPSPDEDESAPLRPVQAADVAQKRRMLGFCFTAQLVCYADRTNLSVAILPMSREFGWSPAQMGVVLSSFFIGYLVTQIPGGVWARRFGAKNVLATGVALWSLATLVTPAAANSSLEALLAIRVFMGLAEGVTMPCVHALLSAWIPPNERSRSVAFSTSGQFVGTALAMLTSTWAERDWPSVFFVFGAAGIAWVLVFLQFGASAPAEAPEGFVSVSALEDGADGVQEEGEGAGMAAEEEGFGASAQIRYFLAHRSVWAAIAAHVAHNWGYYVLLNWLPAYFDSLGVDMAAVGGYALMPYVSMAISDNVCGAVADWLLTQRGWPLLRVRKGAQIVAFAVPGVLLLLLSLVDVTTAWQAALLLSGALGLNAASHSGYWANLIDLAGDPRSAGLLCGISNTLATVPGIVGPLVTGWLLDATGSWEWVFALVSMNYAAGLCVFTAFAQVVPIGAPPSSE